MQDEVAALALGCCWQWRVVHCDSIRLHYVKLPAPLFGIFARTTLLSRAAAVPTCQALHKLNEFRAVEHILDESVYLTNPSLAGQLSSHC